MTNTLKVKRPVVVKTVVTDEFKKQATEDISKEMQMLDAQLMQLQLQNKQIQDQANSMSSSYGEEGLRQIQQALGEIAHRIEQINNMKLELQGQRESINHLALNNVIVTGNLENYVELTVGENLYEKFNKAEILVKDGIIQEISM